MTVAMSRVTRTIAALLTFLLATSLAAQQPPPNQVALAEAREHAKAGRTAEAIAALERVTPPAPAVLNQLRTSDDFKALRDDPRFQAIVAKLTPCTAPQYREFDFWLGEWDVRNAAGQLLGRNRITKRHGGCVVVEEWEGASGGSGSSFNTYDQQTRQWHQFWVDATRTTWVSSGIEGMPATLRQRARGGSMALSGPPEAARWMGVPPVPWRALH